MEGNLKKIIIGLFSVFALMFADSEGMHRIIHQPRKDSKAPKTTTIIVSPAEFESYRNQWDSVTNREDILRKLSEKSDINALLLACEPLTFITLLRELKKGKHGTCNMMLVSALLKAKPK